MMLFFDELNAFVNAVRTRQIDRSDEKKSKAGNYAEDIIDELIDLYLKAFEEGVKDAAEALGVEPDEPTGEELVAIIDKKVDGKDFKDRVRDYVNDSTKSGTSPGEAIARIAETDSMRIYNGAALMTAKDGGAKTKTWVTMGDSRVRDTHEYIDGVTIPIDAEFYTFDGDHAQAPGQFERPENDINCRCWLTFSR